MRLRVFCMLVLSLWMLPAWTGCGGGGAGAGAGDASDPEADPLKTIKMQPPPGPRPPVQR